MQISAACENHISLLSFFWTGNDIGFFSTTNEVRISEGLRVEFEAEMMLESIGWLVAVAFGGTEWQKGFLVLPRFYAYSTSSTLS